MPTYVQHAVLGRIPDVFNAEAIWQAPGLSLFSRRPCCATCWNAARANTKAAPPPAASRM
ncbi:hypothetical protein [Duganella sp. P38]|uniref:hypothetical protein n=1 Tax=Duganella sp. P38 TaxID=3423949 RepID=UPI003D7A47B2